MDGGHPPRPVDDTLRRDERGEPRPCRACSGRPLNVRALTLCDDRDTPAQLSERFYYYGNKAILVLFLTVRHHPERRCRAIALFAGSTSVLAAPF